MGNVGIDGVCGCKWLCVLWIVDIDVGVAVCRMNGSVLWFVVLIISGFACIVVVHVLIVVCFAVFLFLVLPTLLTGALLHYFPGFPLWGRNVLEGLLKICIFLLYLVLCAKQKDIFFKITIPASTPFILVAARLGLSTSMNTLMASEIVGGDKGIETFNERFIDCGVLDFLLREREAGRIRNLGWSFHGDQKVFDHLLAMHDSGEARWDFVQIQMNYVDWKHASDRNVNAEYLYGELEKRGIPAVIMEPLLGGRLSRLNDHLVERLKERRPTESTASWALS